MALLDEPVRGLHGGGHVQSRHDDPEAAPAEARRAEGADGAEGGIGERGERGGEKADGVQFGDQCAGEGESGRVVGRKKTEQVGEFSGQGKRGLVEVGHLLFFFFVFLYLLWKGEMGEETK